LAGGASKAARDVKRNHGPDVFKYWPFCRLLDPMLHPSLLLAGKGENKNKKQRRVQNEYRTQEKCFRAGAPDSLPMSVKPPSKATVDHSVSLEPRQPSVRSINVHLPCVSCNFH
jgi:hypothetical protein